MRAPLSLIACIAVILVLLGYRSYYSEIGGSRRELIVTQWDAFGYYLYLPATLIYHDHKKLDWAAAIDKTYNVTGGDGLPVQKLENGNKVCKYLCGVAILQAPLFALAHGIATVCGCPRDGFSPIYQHALAFGVILYCGLALLLLRRILLRYFSDRVTALTLMLICLASNFIQYAAVNGGLSHAWIFPLYVLLLYSTIRWHEQPRGGWALLTGYLIGLATICRPTEAIALFLPLLWSTHTKEAAQAKWAAVRSNRLHILYAVLGGIAGILPQLIYWYSVTGSPIYDVGSKWMFLNPWFRVLIGWEKGWFIYTPVTILFVAGLAFMKRYDFRRAVPVFCLLNIWIVMAWEDWRYGGSYSTRALVQSYPVFALPLAALISRLEPGRWRWLLYAAAVNLTGVNLFQIVQYNSTILHYNDMNRRYYSRIYLNPDPSPLDMSLLDTEDWLPDEHGYSNRQLISPAQPRSLLAAADKPAVLADIPLLSGSAPGPEWLKVSAHIQAASGVWQSTLTAELTGAGHVKRTVVRLDNPVGNRTGEYAFFMRVPEAVRNGRLKLSIRSPFEFRGELRRLDVRGLSRTADP